MLLYTESEREHENDKTTLQQMPAINFASSELIVPPRTTPAPALAIPL